MSMCACVYVYPYVKMRERCSDTHALDSCGPFSRSVQTPRKKKSCIQRMVERLGTGGWEAGGGGGGLPGWCKTRMVLMSACCVFRVG